MTVPRALARTLTLLAFITLALALLSGAPAYADDPEATLVNVANTAGLISLLIGTVIPLLTGLVTDLAWSPAVRFFVAAALSALTGFLTQWGHALADAEPFQWRTALLSAVLTLAIAELTYARAWRKTKVAEWAQTHGVGSGTDPATVGKHAAVDE